MGQKANPIGARLGIIKGWDSNWFGGNNYSDKLVEDEKIRKYLSARIAKGGVAKVVIERTLKRITVTIHTARPGIVIGKAGAEVDKIKEELKKLTKKEIQINIFEIKRPELDAQLVAEGVAKQLEARISFRRAMKSSIASTMRMGAEGIKIMTSGRLGGAEMARTEQYKEGRVPLHTFRADIDYALAEALTTYGKIGVKVWICKGEVYGKRDLSPNIGAANNGPKGQSDKPAFGGRDNRGGGRDNRGGGNDRRGGNQGGGRGPGQGGANRGGGAGANRGPRK
ncbi:30S ribosomal protein S3 [Pedobacter riviphilus]|uniref:Small ribosomal subunit protein uS3 n=1 Tax=Pedobacter riviphilus TaxID=2766984 RepID=A0ABX6TDG7_9SPHI|nr:MULTISPECIES: 30S ribosomal protein S3 [Pedobacter]NII85604.1 small subunit ribosomal protein S3 [Pedobacter sp. SG908]NMN39479.1 small subunit ribosomal protein S3 [Pedobacter sp. SG918]QNR83528.1 30S ribosomal protein S3 [Pedobacter riviphilus]